MTRPLWPRSFCLDAVSVGPFQRSRRGHAEITLMLCCVSLRLHDTLTPPAAAVNFVSTGLWCWRPLRRRSQSDDEEDFLLPAGFSGNECGAESQLCLRLLSQRNVARVCVCLVVFSLPWHCFVSADSYISKAEPSLTVKPLVDMKMCCCRLFVFIGLIYGIIVEKMYFKKNATSPLLPGNTLFLPCQTYNVLALVEKKQREGVRRRKKILFLFFPLQLESHVTL